MASPTLTTTPNTPRRMQNVSRFPSAVKNPSWAVALASTGLWLSTLALPAPTPFPGPPAQSQQAGRGVDYQSKMHRYRHHGDTHAPVGRVTAGALHIQQARSPLLPPVGWKAAFATGTVRSHSRSLHCPARKDESFRSDSLFASHKPLEVLDSASWEILHLSDPSSAPLCQPDSLSD